MRWPSSKQLSFVIRAAQPAYPQSGGQGASWPGREPGLPGYPTPPQSSGGVYPQVPNGGQYPAWSNPGYAQQGTQGYAAAPNPGYPNPSAYGALDYGAPGYGASGYGAGGFAPPPSELNDVRYRMPYNNQ